MYTTLFLILLAVRHEAKCRSQHIKIPALSLNGTLGTGKVAKYPGRSSRHPDLSVLKGVQIWAASDSLVSSNTFTFIYLNSIIRHSAYNSGISSSSVQGVLYVFVLNNTLASSSSLRLTIVTFSDNHAGSSSSKAAEKHPSDGKASRESRLERYKKDNEDDLFSRLHDAQPTSQNPKEKFGPCFAKLPPHVHYNLSPYFPFGWPNLVVFHMAPVIMSFLVPSFIKIRENNSWGSVSLVLFKRPCATAQEPKPTTTRASQSTIEEGATKTHGLRIDSTLSCHLHTPPRRRRLIITQRREKARYEAPWTLSPRNKAPAKRSRGSLVGYPRSRAERHARPIFDILVLDPNQTLLLLGQVKVSHIWVVLIDLRYLGTIPNNLPTMGILDWRMEIGISVYKWAAYLEYAIPARPTGRGELGRTRADGIAGYSRSQE
ncbi:uncharacterized protein CLUP02_06346 [Colletotrichum lupini]|uniref:Uncharacterized protein n=1 Tax=Colletotrichum lupini TaxID=145971 RepID=A0A9Q8SQ56_9PEZI|nr:uncharacterized protein CLUP02_06346 [Colletotrichum lupini]UQC80861.1 hypothetical protein CLUP02_06346 [Colletotrichum lupini]